MAASIRHGTVSAALLMRKLAAYPRQNQIARALHEIGQRGELRDRAFQDQVHRASCLHLLIAAIGAWTTPYLADAVDARRAAGEAVPDEDLAHLSPLTWEHVNLLGQYAFDPQATRALDDRRPLRGGTADDGLDEEAGP